MSANPDNMLDAANQLDDSDPDKALALRVEVARGEVSWAWSRANTLVAFHLLGALEFVRAIEHANAVLQAPHDRIDPKALCWAGILASQAQLALAIAVDQPLVERSIAAAVELSAPDLAGEGLLVLADIVLPHGDVAAARAHFVSAADYLELAGFMTRAPYARMRLAELAIAAGETSYACDQLRRGIAWLERFPYGGFVVRMAHDKFVAMMRTIGCEP